MYIIAMYDINTETKAGRRRLRLIFKLMKKIPYSYPEFRL